MSEPAAGTRAEQRERTRARILEVARRTFAEHGYDRTTVRAVASAANVNPGLVMHYFGAKQRLFTEATRATDADADPDAGEAPVAGTPGELADLLLRALHTKLAGEPTETLAMLRSMLTHPEAARDVRESLNRQQRQLAEVLAATEAGTTGAGAAEDAALRTGLTGAITLGVVVGRYLLELDGLRDASPDRITELLRPGFEALVADQPRHQPRST